MLKKALLILFSIYFIALAVMPCADKVDCNEFKQTASQESHKQEHSDEVCSPFCVCACCATHFLIKDFQPSLKQVAVINTHYSAHKESKISAAIIPIWQPPKLA